MFTPESASPHGSGTTNEVLVVGDVDGEQRNVLLREVPELTTEYRELERQEKIMQSEHRARKEKAAFAMKSNIQAAEEALAEAQRQHAETLRVEQDAFQTKCDAIVAEASAAAGKRAQQKAKIDARAFKLAEEQFADQVNA